MAHTGLCPGGHELEYYSGTHMSSHFSYLMGTYCDSCRCSIDKTQRGVGHCRQCQFDICQRCLPFGPLRCPNRHPMVTIKRRPESYTAASWGCKRCKQELPLFVLFGAKAVSHCGQCEYVLCSQCCAELAKARAVGQQPEPALVEVPQDADGDDGFVVVEDEREGAPTSSDAAAPGVSSDASAEALLHICDLIAHRQPPSAVVVASLQRVSRVMPMMKDAVRALGDAKPSERITSCELLGKLICCTQKLLPLPFSLVFGLMGAVCGAAAKVQVHKHESQRLSSRLCALHPILMKAMTKNVPDKSGLCERMTHVLNNCRTLLEKFAPVPAADSFGQRFCLWAKQVIASVKLHTSEFETCHTEIDRIIAEYNFLVLVHSEPCPTAKEIAAEAQLSLHSLLSDARIVVQESLTREAGQLSCEMTQALKAQLSELEALVSQQLRALDAKMDLALAGISDITVMMHDALKLKKIERLTVPEERVTLGSECLGEGAFGRVVSAKLMLEEVAAKSLTRAVTEEKCHQLLDEMLLHMELVSPNIVRCYGVCCKDGVSYMLLQRCHCSLREYVREHGPVDWRVATRLTLSLCSALLTLHSAQPQPIIHCDVKLDNAMLLGSVVMLSDLGSARRQRVPSSVALLSSTCGTVGMTENYAAPEMMSKPDAKATTKVDVYALVLVLYELCTGETPFRPYLERPRVPAFLPESLQQLMQQGWATRPEERPTMQTVFDTLQRQLYCLSEDEQQQLSQWLKTVGHQAEALQLKTTEMRQGLCEAPTEVTIPATSPAPIVCPPAMLRDTLSPPGAPTKPEISDLGAPQLASYLKQRKMHTIIVRYVEDNEIDGGMLLHGRIMAALDQILTEEKVPPLHMIKWHDFLGEMQQHQNETLT